MALVVLEQKIRPDAGETLEYFAEQKVSVKVISGDNAVSVGAVASSLGLASGERPVDARTLPEDREQLADAVASSKPRRANSAVGDWYLGMREA